MKRALIFACLFFWTWACGAAEQAGFRVVHFPKDRAVGRLKVWDGASDTDFDRGMLSLPGWVLIGQAQGDVNVPVGKDLRLEVYEDAADFSFLAALKPDDVQVLLLRSREILDEDLVHLKHLSGLKGLDLSETKIQGDGLVHLANLSSLKNLNFFNSQISDTGLLHLAPLRSLRRLKLFRTQINGSGLKHLKGMTSLIHLDLAATPITDDSLIHLAQMNWLKELYLYDTDISDKGLAHLKSLHGLEELILGRLDSKGAAAPITDKGLVYLKDLNSLKTLYLIRTKVNDAGLAHLSNLRTLESLHLAQTQIIGEGLASLKGLPALKYLGMERTQIGPNGLAACRMWWNTLESLELDGTNISDADLVYLEGSKVLKNLSIASTPITDAGLVHVSKINSLESLTLSKTRITDDGLMVLKDLANLQRIYVTDSLVTNSGLENFKQASSASKSLKANVTIGLVVTKEKGMTVEESSTPMPELQIIPLRGKPIPDFEGIKIGFDPKETRERCTLICFFDMTQRPSRNCLQQLSKMREALAAKDVIVIAIQASKIEQNALTEWTKENDIPYPVGRIESEENKIQAAWGVKALPWLILTDKEHVVTAEGFGINELEDKIKAVNQ